MATTVKPDYIDLRGKLPFNQHNADLWLRRRPVGNIHLLPVHYGAGAHVPENSSQADEEALIRSYAAYHISKDWAAPQGIYGWTIMYTYVVGPSGRIYQVNDETAILWNTCNANPICMATVLLLGSGQQPTAAQLATLGRHLDYLISRGDIPATRANVWGHGELGGIYGGGTDYGNRTDCPGLALDFARKYRKGLVNPAPVPVPVPIPAPAPEYGHLFDGEGETGFFVGGSIWRYFSQQGAVPAFGLPVSGEIRETLGDGNEYTVQYFERDRLEYHPGAAPQDVMVGLVGSELLQARGVDVKVMSLDAVAADFKAYYAANGGLPVLGLPLNDEHDEVLSDGKSYRVQYFERARLERHPEGVMKGRIGVELMAALSHPKGAVGAASFAGSCGCGDVAQAA